MFYENSLSALIGELRELWSDPTQSRIMKIQGEMAIATRLGQTDLMLLYKYDRLKRTWRNLA